MTIQRVHPAYAEGFYALWQTVSEQGDDVIGPPPSLEKVKRVLTLHSEKTAPSFIYLKDGALVASAEVFPSPKAGEEKQGILGVQVHPDYRRRGIAKQLLNAVLVDCQRYGIEQVDLTVYQHNAGAIRLYQQFGFQPREAPQTITLPSGRAVLNQTMTLSLAPSR
ncbi:GNAT family N-acetyltransferase [Photobacterium japonica]|uniref:GNAT family N-acetyltransferase n=1 Tax=Photobacterium japonica TaxID=2910235 RepID=UPI003D1312D1